MTSAGSTNKSRRRMQIMEGLPNQEVSSTSLPVMENLAFIVDAREFVSMFCVCGYVLQRHMQRMEGPPPSRSILDPCACHGKPGFYH